MESTYAKGIKKNIPPMPGQRSESKMFVGGRSRASFLDRLKSRKGTKIKRILASYVACNLVRRGDKIFILSGTTSCLTAEQIMSEVEDVALFTNSVPVLWRALELADAHRLASGLVVHAIGGEVNTVTGIIGNPNLSNLPADTVIYSPHGLTPRGIEGDRDVPFIQAVLSQCQRIIMPITAEKFNFSANHVVKHLGHISKDIRNKRRTYRIVIPPTTQESKDSKEIQTLLQGYEDAGVEVCRVSREFAKALGFHASIS